VGLERTPNPRGQDRERRDAEFEAEESKFPQVQESFGGLGQRPVAVDPLRFGRSKELFHRRDSGETAVGLESGVVGLDVVLRQVGLTGTSRCTVTISGVTKPFASAHRLGDELDVEVVAHRRDRTRLVVAEQVPSPRISRSRMAILKPLPSAVLSPMVRSLSKAVSDST